MIFEPDRDASAMTAPGDPFVQGWTNCGPGRGGHVDADDFHGDDPDADIPGSTRGPARPPSG